MIRSGLAEHEKRLLAVDLNMARRQLTDGQKAMLGREIEPDIAEQARQRQIALAGTRTDGRPSGQVSGRSETRDEVARAVGLGSGDTYERAKKTIESVEQEAPELVPEIASGALDLGEVRSRLLERGGCGYLWHCQSQNPSARRCAASYHAAAANRSQSEPIHTVARRR